MKKIISFIGLFYLLLLLSPTLVKAQDNFQTYTPIEVDPIDLGTGQEFFLSKYFYPKAFHQMPEYREKPVTVIGDKLGDEKEVYLHYNIDEDSYNLIFPAIEHYYSWDANEAPFLIFDVYTKEAINQNSIAMSFRSIPIDEDIQNVVGMQYYPHSNMARNWECEITAVGNGESRIRFYIYPWRDNQTITERIGLELGTWYSSGLLESAERIEIIKYKTGPSGIEELRGSGTTDDPYRIENISQLEIFREKVNSGNSKAGEVYKLMSDLDLRGMNWLPIGNDMYRERFDGIFLGEKHVIRNFTVTQDGFGGVRGMFGATGTNAVIKNLILENANVSGENSIAACLVGINSGTILECAVRNSKSSGSNLLGLLVGFNRVEGSISKCYVQGVLTGSGITGSVGGICGRNVGNPINNCCADVVINGIGETIGGILGSQTETYSSPITYCYSKGQINSIAGGISGKTYSPSGNIQNCVSLITLLQQGVRIGTGKGKVQNCYANGDMLVKGVKKISTDPNSIDGADITLAQAKIQSFWAGIGYDFTIWKMSSPCGKYQGYPILQWMEDDLSNISIMLGSGTIGVPYQIETVCQLEKLRDEVNAGDAKTGKFYKLMNDLDLDGTSNWVPIGNYSTGKAFNGTFLGENHSIKNLNITGNLSDKALFGYTGKSAVIKNLSIENANIENPDGGLTACLVSYNAGTITECAVINSKIHNVLNEISDSEIGFLAAHNIGTISKCYAQGDIYDVVNVSVVGSICGYDDSDAIKSITNCFSDCSISSIVKLENWYQNAAAYCYSKKQVNSNTPIVTVLSSGKAPVEAVFSQPINQQYWAAAGFDFATNWKMSNPCGKYQGYPILKWMQDTPFPTMSGSGTSTQDPYKIESVCQLQILANEVNAGDSKKGKFYTLANDLDLSSVPYWLPIGNYASQKPFEAWFIGNNHKIKNLNISGNFDAQALFGYVGKSGEIGRLQIENATVSGRYNHACLIAVNEGSITYSSVTKSKSTGQGNGGLLVAENQSLTAIVGCYAQGTVTGTEKAIGGICGVNNGNDAGRSSIRECFTNVILNGAKETGGIVGLNGPLATGTELCYSLGQINSGTKVGGICGANTVSATKIINCVTLMASSNTGARICNNLAGALIQNCYANKDMLLSGIKKTSTNPNSIEGADITLAQAKTQSFWNNNGFIGSPAFNLGFGKMTDPDGEFQGYPILFWMQEDPCLIKGLGTQEVPYKIETVCQLEKFRDEVNAGDSKTGKYYKLMNDLDLSIIPNWEPIGVFAQGNFKPFNGTFLGEKHTIKNLTIKNLPLGSCALFCCAGRNAIIKNVILDSANIQTNKAIHGSDRGDYVACLVSFNYGIITECAVINSKVSGHGFLGLLVAYNQYDGVISKCYAQGIVDGHYEFIGGICGHTENQVEREEFSNCYADVVLYGWRFMGGISGYVDCLDHCYSKGQIIAHGPADFVGGISGGHYKTLKNSVSLMTSIETLSGWPGRGFRISQGTTTSEVNCYANKDMLLNGVTITSINPNSRDGADITLAQAKTQTFWKNTVGFNFDSIWSMNTMGDGYPVLQWIPNQYRTKSLVRQNLPTEQLNTATATTATTARLDQNAPNPFSGNTSIGYYIPETAKQADLYIYNLLGQQVKGATITTRGQGEYTINNSELTVGTYIYKLVVDGQIIGTKKMMLAK